MTPEEFNLWSHIHRHIKWSLKTFGRGLSTHRLIDHIKKELVEIEAAPHDVSEWIDVAMLALDGAWRAGATPDEIIMTLQAKQVINETRKWPDWRTADPDKAMEHVRK